MFEYRSIVRKSAALLALLALQTPLASYALTCPELVGGKHHRELTREEAKSLMDLMPQVAGDTTGLRREIKLVVPQTAARNFLDRLSEAYGSGLKSRNESPAGFVSVTETVYPESFRFRGTDGIMRSLKPRIRTYYDKGLATASRLRSAFTANRRFIELKFEHFDFLQVIVKGRLALPDAFVEATADLKTLNSQFSDIVDAAKSEPVNSNSPVEQILSFIRDLQTGRVPNRLGPYLTISYERLSVKKTLTRFDGSEVLDANGKPAQIEITVDKNIQITEAGKSEPAYEFPRDVMIVETKVPLEFANMTDVDVQNIVELGPFRMALSDLRAQRVPEFPENRGKFSAYSRMRDKDER